MGFRKMGIRTKLILTFLMVGIAPLVLSNTYSFLKTSEEVTKFVENKVNILAHQKSNAIESYFEREASMIVDLSDSEMVADAVHLFASPFQLNLPAEQEKSIRASHIDLVSQFYHSKFGSEYQKRTNEKLNVDQLIGRLDTFSVLAQYDFIANNDHPLGQKNNMLLPKRESPYAKVHERFHPYFQNLLSRHGFYDIFLVDTSGRVVYSVFKETDFATSLRQGPFSDTGLAKAFEKSLKLGHGEVHIEDFSPYTPSYEAPSSFLSSPIVKNGQTVGVFIVQLPIDKITAVVNDRQGLGDKGETLLLGSDMRLRADTFRNKESHNLANSFAKNSTVSIESEAVRLAKLGQSGFLLENISYDGLKTAAYYKPLKIRNLNWYVITEVAHDEIFSILDSLMFSTIIILSVGMVVTGAFAAWFGTAIGGQLRAIAVSLGHSSQEVSSASSQSASSSTELSEASTEQAASLQETMASVEEISAMVSQNAESAQKTQNVVEVNRKASDEGSRSVQEMMGAINEIRDTNEEILGQMEKSHKEFDEIVRIISDIGEKTTVINEIVFQTKLLSFNASVEAARAGEHGKGFAVVAEEVGNLAQMSGNAAKEITDMLSDSIKRVNGIVESTRERVERLMEAGKDKIAMGQSTAEKCKEALRKIDENARTVATMINEIAQASKEQAQGIQEINKAISQLDQVTQQNSSVAQLSSTQAEKLNSEALALSAMVSKLRFFVEGGVESGSHRGVKTDEVSDKKGQVIPLALKRTDKNRHSHVTAKAVPDNADSQFEDF
jgi:methyl-accepting chemotaxis protein